MFNNGRKAFEVGVPATDVPTMPIEFAVAAYRLGHSMIRQDYSWNDIFDNDSARSTTSSNSPPGAATSAAIRGCPSIWVADFRRLYDFKEAGRADLAVPEAQVQPGACASTPARAALATLPGFAGGRGQPRLPQPHPGARW